MIRTRILGTLPSAACDPLLEMVPEVQLAVNAPPVGPVTPLTVIALLPVFRMVVGRSAPAQPGQIPPRRRRKK
jgi:hypothetical protein